MQPPGPSGGADREAGSDGADAGRAGDGGGQPGRAPALLPAAPLIVALVGLFPVGLAAQALQPALGLLWTELFVFLVPAAALAARAGLPPALALRLGAPPRGALPLAALAGAAAFLAGGTLMALWARLLPPELVHDFDVTRLFDRPGWELGVMVAAAALLAPLCEEVAFRGHLLTALGLRRRPGAAIALSALLFAALHLDPVRLPALIFLGGLYGWLAWRSGSVWPAVLAHAVNNAAATALALQAGEAPAPEAAAPLAAAVVLAASALALWPVLRAYHRTMPPPVSPAAAFEAARAGGVRRDRWVTWAVAAGAVALLAITLLLGPPGGSTG